MKFLTLILLLASILSTFAQSPSKLLIESRKIVFLGDSITYAGDYVANFDTWIHAYYQKRRFEILNLGLGSETVSGLSEKGHAGGKFPRPDLHTRLDSILEKTKPDLIFACYGMNCGIQMPFDEDRFQKYKDGITKLKIKAEASGAKIIFLTPPIYDGYVNKKKAYYTDVLAKYAAWLVEQRKNGWNVIDLNTHMAKVLEEQRKTNPAFTYQKDAVHPNTQGHWIMTQPIIAYFGDTEAANCLNINEVLALHKLPASISKLTARRSQILRNAYLTYTGHKRPGVPKGLPLEEAKQEAKKLTTQIKSLYKLAGQ